ncbi:hypothetical protein ANMWB30_23750 [Arthrobacter sp. MWB30]|nr:hypothetical protein ANMWB30_23750 [Arthrobacter sp. MWB30]
MSLAVNAAMEALRTMELDEEDVDELSRRIKRGELTAERIINTITVQIETLDGENAAVFLRELADRFETITTQEYMAGGQDLCGYDGVMAQSVKTSVEVGDEGNTATVKSC